MLNSESNSWIQLCTCLACMFSHSDFKMPYFLMIVDDLTIWSAFVDSRPSSIMSVLMKFTLSPYGALWYRSTRSWFDRTTSRAITCCTSNVLDAMISILQVVMIYWLTAIDNNVVKKNSWKNATQTLLFMCFHGTFQSRIDSILDWFFNEKKFQNRKRLFIISEGYKTPFPPRFSDRTFSFFNRAFHAGE